MITRLKQFSHEQWLSFLAAAVVFFLPWQTRLVLRAGELNGGGWEYGTYSLYAVDFLVILFLLVSLTKWREFKWNTVATIGLLFMGAGSVSLIDASSLGLGGYWLVKLIEAVLIGLCLSQAWIQRTLIAVGVIAAGAVQSVLALWQFAVQHVFASKWLGMSEQNPEWLGVQVIEQAGERTLRAYGSLPHPNMLAGFLVVAIFVGFAVWIEHRRKSSLWVLMLLSAGLWATFSRQAWIALVVAGGLLLVRWFFRGLGEDRALMKAGLAVAGPFILLSALFPQLIATRIQGNERLEQRSIQERQEFAQESQALSSEHWFNGVGIGNYTYVLFEEDEERGATQESYTYQPVHNIYLLTLSELGLFALIPFGALAIFLLRAFSTATKKTIGFVCAMVSLLVIGLFDHYLWSLHFGILLFWLTLITMTQQEKESIATPQ